jgi:hypothetical protein
MKLFKSVDEKLSEIGFVKIKEDKHGASYERKDNTYGYVQCLDLGYKENSRHLIQSSQKDINKDGFNNMVGLSMYEAKLAVKKMKQMGWKPVNN